MCKIAYAVIARLTKSAEAISWRGSGLLSGVYPEWDEILRFAQNDKKRRARNDIRGKAQNDMEMV
ncbi:MAG: hypothetical protein WB564_08890 [Dehalococcoidia bacterium]